jgi:Fic-DOC domain mobile mystery protein B
VAPDDLFDAGEGNTPLSAEERAGLIPALATRTELNEWERENILLARRWALAPRQLKRYDALTEDYLRRLHRKMFDGTWRWAGQFRVSERNLGLPVHQLTSATRDLLDDARYWLAHQTFVIDEIAVRVHHRLVSIHPWPNGNGRHARLLGDVLAVHHGQNVFSWGRHANLVTPGSARGGYLAALRAADHQDYAPLVRFARS